MPWCPKCKLEYKAGITICPDCGSAMVEELIEEEPFVSVAILPEAAAAERLVSFLAAENLEGLTEPASEPGAYEIKVPQSQASQAKKCVKAFCQVELELAAKEKLSSFVPEASEELPEGDTLEEEPFNNTAPSKGPYVKKAEKSKDLKSTGYTFLVVGVLGLIFLVLNITGVIPYFNSVFSYVVVGAMLLAFLWIGISSLRQSKQTASEAVLEEELTKKINTWLSLHLTRQLLDSFADPDQSEEINFMREMEGIKELLITEFGTIDDAYLDSVVEEYYNETFDSQESE